MRSDEVRLPGGSGGLTPGPPMNGTAAGGDLAAVRAAGSEISQANELINKS